MTKEKQEPMTLHFTMICSRVSHSVETGHEAELWPSEETSPGPIWGGGEIVFTGLDDGHGFIPGQTYAVEVRIA